MRFPSLKIVKKRARRVLTGARSPQEHIRQLQKQHRPHYDPLNSLLRSVRKCLPPEVDAMFGFGILWEGEVGVMEARAAVQPVPLGEEHAIVLYSGIKSLLYTVARAMAAATPIHFDPPAPPVPATLQLDNVASMLGDVFFAYAKTNTLVTPQHALHAEQKKLAHWVATSAEFFLLAHEVAHAWVDYAGTGDAGTALGGKPSKDEELACDYLALQWLLTDALTRPAGGEPPPNVRMVYSGAEFAIRVWACLEHVGMPFEDTHPVAQDRLDLLRQAGATICKQLGVAFDDVRTIAVAHDSMLDEIERTAEAMVRRSGTSAPRAPS